MASLALFPLAIATLKIVLAALKKAGYRSTEAYVAPVRVRNEELGYGTSPELRVWIRGAERSLARGRGRGRRAVVFDPREAVDWSTA